MARKTKSKQDYPSAAETPTKEHVLHDVTSALVEESDVESVLGRIARQVMQSLRADAVWYLLWGEEKRDIFHYFFGVLPNPIGKADAVKVNETVASGFDLADPIFVSDVRKEERIAKAEVLREAGIRSLAILPLKTDQGTIGVTNIAGRRVRDWSPEDRELVECVGPELALVVAKARSYEQLYADLGEHRRQASLQQVQRDVHDAIFHLRDPEGIQLLVQSLQKALKRLEIPFDFLSIQLCSKEDCTAYYNAPGGHSRQRVESLAGTPVEVALRSQNLVYRGDLDTDDPYGERRGIETVYGQSLRCLVDIPFAAGTLRFGSERPRAFSGPQLGLLQEVAHGISAGMDRFQEFLRLYQRTERQAMQLHRAQQAAALVQRAMAAAHDLRSPLQGIWGCVDLLSDALPEDNPQQKHIQAIQKGLDHVQKLVDTLQRPAPFDEEPLEQVRLEEMISFITDRLAPALAKQQIRCTKVLEGAFSPVTCRPRVMERALENLARNAVEAMPDGGELRVEMKQTNEQVAVRICDTGPGIPADAQAHLFEPFYSTKGTDSMGLGLWIVREIIEQHSGTVEVESSLGEGTTFIVRIPADLTPP